MSRQQIEEERWKLSMKFFDYADNPIKEWIANYLDTEPATIFTDYSTESDVIIINIDDKSYSVYLSTCPNNLRDGTAFHFDQARLKETENLRNATSMLFDAVFTVFPNVIKSHHFNEEKGDERGDKVNHKMNDKMNKDIKNILLDVHPRFHNETMSFYFEMINKKRYEYEREKENLMKLYGTLEQVRQKLVGFKSSDDPAIKNNKELIGAGEQLVSKMTSDAEQLASKINALSRDEIEENELQCAAMNKILQERDCRLYMVLEENTELYSDALIKKLPEIGTRYMDPYAF